MRPARVLFAVSVAVFGGSVSIPAAEIVLPGKEAHPGASVVLPVAFRGQGNSVSALQFDLEYDNAAYDIALVVADSARVSGKNLYSADVAPNRKRILVAGLNQNVLPDGVLFRIFVNVRPDASTGAASLTVVQPVASDPAGRAVSLSATLGVITVQAGQGSALSEEGVLNAASLLAGPIAPGELITLIGSSIGPRMPVQPEGGSVETLLGGTRVLFDGVAAALFYVASGQINVVAPGLLSKLDSVRIETELEGQVSSSVIVPVASVSPGLFTAGGTGTGQGVALHEDTTWNGPGNPVSRGSIVTIFATGTGEMDERGSRLPVQVRIGELDAEVISAGAISVTPAVTQIICRVPAGTSPGLSVPVKLEIGGRSSQSGVTIAVR